MRRDACEPSVYDGKEVHSYEGSPTPPSRSKQTIALLLVSITLFRNLPI